MTLTLQDIEALGQRSFSRTGPVNVFPISKEELYALLRAAEDGIRMRAALQEIAERASYASINPKTQFPINTLQEIVNIANAGLAFARVTTRKKMYELSPTKLSR